MGTSPTAPTNHGDGATLGFAGSPAHALSGPFSECAHGLSKSLGLLYHKKSFSIKGKWHGPLSSRSGQTPSLLPPALTPRAPVVLHGPARVAHSVPSPQLSSFSDRPPMPTSLGPLSRPPVPVTAPIVHASIHNPIIHFVFTAPTPARNGWFRFQGNDTTMSGCHPSSQNLFLNPSPR